MSARPDFAILFYPVISMNERETHRGSCVEFLGENRKDAKLQKEWSSDKAVRRHLVPPTMLIFSNDDKVVPPVTNAVAYYSALRGAGANCSMLCYPTGGHGWGFRSNFKYHELMLMELTQWLNDLKMPSESSVKVACVGNSITDGHGIDVSDLYGYPARLGNNLGQNYTVKNFGVSGRTLSNSGDYPYQKEEAWKRCLEWQPEIVVIKLGTNDTKTHNWKTAEGDIKSSMKTMIDSLRALPTNPRIIVTAPIPSFKNVWDIRDSVTVNSVIPQIQEFVKNENLEYLDLYNAMNSLENFQKEYLLRDGVHPNEKGCQKLADLVAAKIKSPVSVAKIKDKKIKKRKK
jgi:lysophospholipase L1-like esterase